MYLSTIFVAGKGLKIVRKVLCYDEYLRIIICSSISELIRLQNCSNKTAPSIKFSNSSKIKSGIKRIHYAFTLKDKI